MSKSKPTRPTRRTKPAAALRQKADPVRRQRKATVAPLAVSSALNTIASEIGMEPTFQIEQNADGSLTVTMPRPVTLTCELDLFELREDLSLPYGYEFPADRRQYEEHLAHYRRDFKSRTAANRRENRKYLAAGGPEMLAAAIECRRYGRHYSGKVPPPDQIMQLMPEMRRRERNMEAFCEREERRSKLDTRLMYRAMAAAEEEMISAI